MRRTEAATDAHGHGQGTSMTKRQRNLRTRPRWTTIVDNARSVNVPFSRAVGAPPIEVYQRRRRTCGTNNQTPQGTIVLRKSPIRPEKPTLYFRSESAHSDALRTMENQGGVWPWTRSATDKSGTTDPIFAGHVEGVVMVEEP
ncbi:hypothetical protein HDG35_007226 [Paraburkholderia sp. JPY681]|nr:hypothetical protein [Paraburkholderia atlantica]